MTRIDWVILRRLAGRIGLTIVLMFGMITLVESLNTWRFNHLSAAGGPMLGLSAILLNAALWSLSVLPVTLLIGAIVGLIDLQQRRELTVISATGVSVWQMLRAPLFAVLVVGSALAVSGDTLVVTMMRSISVVLPQPSEDGALWLQQRGDGQDYILAAEHVHPGGGVLEDVTFFLPAALGGPRLHADRAEIRDGAWHIATGIRYAPDTAPEAVSNLDVPTTTTLGDLGARLTSPADMTIFDLMQVQALEITDPRLRSGVQMRLAKLVALPLSLAASLLIAFAFTSGYRRTNKYGSTVLYGIVLGFVVYVVTEMAATAGSTGILQPAFAAFAPALVAIVVGTTVLLFREDGRR
jgi:lipopolysaccharide export system permease protein